MALNSDKFSHDGAFNQEFAENLQINGKNQTLDK